MNLANIRCVRVCIGCRCHWW